MRHKSRDGVALLPLLKAFFAMAPRSLWLGGAALAALTVLMGMSLLGLSGWFITATALAGLVPATALVFDVFKPSAGIRLLAVGRTGARYAERLITHDATLAVLAALRHRLFLHWAQPQAARLLLQRPAKLLQRLTADVDALDNLYLRLLVPAVSALGSACLLALAYGLMRWWLALLALAWMLLAGWGIAVWHGLRSRRAAVRRAMALEAMRVQTVDAVAGQTDLLMAGQWPRQMHRILRSEARAARADHELYRKESAVAKVYGGVSAITLSASMLLMAWLLEQGLINAPVAAMGVLLALSAMEPFAALRRGAEQAGRIWLALRRVAPALQPEPAGDGQQMAPATVPDLPEQPEVAMPAVDVRAAQLRQIGPLNLSVQPGERVVLIGASGAGKSTLLQLLAGELQPAQGRVQACPASWMTQRTELFQDSLRDNLRLARPDASDAQLWDALAAAGLQADVQALPQGLHTPLGEGGMGLSGGQARRLALARLLLSPRRLWLLDEVTEGLDAVTACDVLQRLGNAAQGRTLIFATHWQREARLADRLVHLQAGRIQQQALRGTPEFEQLLAQLRSDEVRGVAQGKVAPAPLQTAVNPALASDSPASRESVLLFEVPGERT